MRARLCATHDRKSVLGRAAGACTLFVDATASSPEHRVVWAAGSARRWRDLRTGGCDRGRVRPTAAFLASGSLPGASWVGRRGSNRSPPPENHWVSTVRGSLISTPPPPDLDLLLLLLVPPRCAILRETWFENYAGTDWGIGTAFTSGHTPCTHDTHNRNTRTRARSRRPRRAHHKSPPFRLRPHGHANTKKQTTRALHSFPPAVGRTRFCRQTFFSPT